MKRLQSTRRLLHSRPGAESFTIAVLLVLFVQLAGCGEPAPRPWILLLVADTTRADAISAHGEVEGTTPIVDALAEEGLLYSHAYANAPWTLPSHTTLFTGLLPQQHGVGWQGLVAPDSVHTLAEALAEAGYDTLGLTENGWISETFNLAQGFRHHERVMPKAKNAEFRDGDDDPMVFALAERLAQRDSQDPLFVFVNIVDAHWPYQIREDNPFLPPGVSSADAGTVAQWPPEYFCSDEPLEREWAVQRGLYLGDVHEADRRLGEIRQQLVAASGDSGLITIFTSDHGEHFGEHRRANHQFSLYEALLRVPLVVHGLPDTAPAVIPHVVQLADLYPSILQWAGARGALTSAGQPVPIAPQASRERRPIVARFRDPDVPYPDEPGIAQRFRAQTRVLRTHCDSQERVWGDMQSILLSPHKLIQYERFPSEVYDLGSDPDEREDIAALEPGLTAELETALREATATR